MKNNDKKESAKCEAKPPIAGRSMAPIEPVITLQVRDCHGRQQEQIIQLAELER